MSLLNCKSWLKKKPGGRPCGFPSHISRKPFLHPGKSPSCSALPVLNLRHTIAISQHAPVPGSPLGFISPMLAFLYSLFQCIQWFEFSNTHMSLYISEEVTSKKHSPYWGQKVMRYFLWKFMLRSWSCEILLFGGAESSVTLGVYVSLYYVWCSLTNVW